MSNDRGMGDQGVGWTDNDSADVPPPMNPLPDIIERILVEALAQHAKHYRDVGFGYPKPRPKPDSRKVTIDIIRKVADKMEEEMGTGLGLQIPASHVHDWLRSQIDE